MGYARGIGLIIFAYTNVPTPFLERTISAFSKKIRRDINGNYRDSNDMLIENWGFSDNLMLEGSIYNSGGVLIKEYVTEEEQFEYLGGFEKCLRHARAELQISRYCRSNNKIKIKKQISY
jgi:nucleoside 2-deoxyribosyltransferase